MIRPGLRASILALSLLAAAGASAGCDMNVANGNFDIGLASGRASDTWTKSWPVAAGTRFALRNVNGGVTVQPAPAGAPLEVKAERVARSSTDEAARELLKKIEIVETVTGGSVLVETRAPKTWGRDGHEVKYTVVLPDGVSLDVQNTNGGIDVKGATGGAVVRTTNGGIKATDMKGQVEARTTNGGITVALAAAPGPMTLETVNGGISVEVPASTAADIAAHVTNGGIHVDDALRFEAVGAQNRRNVAGKLNGGGSKIEASTTNGGIHVSAR